MQANARLTPNQASKEKGKRKIRIPDFLKGQADKGNIPKIECTYNDTTGKFVSADPPPPHEHPLQTPQGDELKINTDLQKALKRCEDLQILTQLNIDVQNCSWKDVFAQMTKANLDYQNRGEGLKYSMNRLWRAMGRQAENAKPWIELIPGDMGLDTLKAGLALCFSLAQNSFEKNAKILNAFEEIPFIIIRAEMMRKNFPTDEHLKSRCIELYETILKAISTLIVLLLPEIKNDNHRTDRNAVKGFSPFRGRISSTEQIDATLDTVKGEADELKRLTEQLWEALIVKLDKYVAILVQQGIENEGWNKQFETKQDTFEEKQDTFGEKQDTFGEKQDTLLQKQGTLEENQDKLKREMGFIKTTALENQEMIRGIVEKAQKRDGLDVMNYLIPFMEQREDQIHRDGFRAGLEHARSQTPNPNSEALISEELFMTYLGVSSHQLPKDLESVLKQGNSFGPMAMSQAQGLLRTDQFRQWCQLRPNFLLVDGNIESSGFERLSAVSYLCASLVASFLKVRDNAIVLHFFCGLHTRLTDELRGPRGLLRSLLWQLVTSLASRQPVSLEFIDDRERRDAIEQRDLGMLCYVFRNLITQLRLDTPVYCIVDGVDWYEEAEFRADMDYVVHSLRDLVDDKKLKPTFKVLMASSFRTRHIGRNLHSRYRLSLRAEVSDMGVVSERMVADRMEELKFEKRSYRKRPSRQGLSDEEDYT